MLADKPTILIADDEPNICRIVKLIISPDEFDILTAENGEDAYEKTIKFQPDLVFSDILMPKCDGFELCHKIKINPYTAHIPFIFLTGLDETQFKSRLADVQADDYLVKPFSSHDMKEKVFKWIKKPMVHSEPQLVTTTKAATTTIQFQFGNDDLDHQLKGVIEPETFMMIQGPIGSGKTYLTRQFLLEGIQHNHASLIISFEPPKKSVDPLFHLPHTDASLIQFYDASSWSGISSPPWRNLDYIYDFLHTECEKRTYNRIVFDSFSQGFSFWSVRSILQFIDLCRSLPNASEQCLLWTLNCHPNVSSVIYEISQLMDIGIATKHNNSSIAASVMFSKWSHSVPILESKGALPTPTTSML